MGRVNKGMQRITVPAGAVVYCRDGARSRKVKKEWLPLALPTTAEGHRAWSIKLGDELWYVFDSEVPDCGKNLTLFSHRGWGGG